MNPGVCQDLFLIPDLGVYRKNRYDKITHYAIFPLTRYPAPERKMIKIMIAARYAIPAVITIGRRVSSRIRIKKAIRPIITSRSRASIGKIFVAEEYRFIRCASGKKNRGGKKTAFK